MKQDNRAKQMIQGLAAKNRRTVIILGLIAAAIYVGYFLYYLYR
ncbi:MAG: hypothetical protein ACE5GZ_12650 [Gammaproteobacteria bacterium]